ncbi:MAG TPA: methyltransferase domain-containing protein [Holophagaceae bacterium]
MRCTVCGSSVFNSHPVLWDDLIAEWQLSPHEVEYINLQQGMACTNCGSNLRSQALALAIQTYLGSNQLLEQLVFEPELASKSILEINEAGMLTRHLRVVPRYRFAAYPEVDMHAMMFESSSFDLVVHSDTLEHVAQPIRALAECCRVLRPGGALCFTVPIIVGRLSRDRGGLAPSYHGNPTSHPEDFVVHTEFGADVWTSVILAGFKSVEIVSLNFPAGIALIARKADA